RGRSYSKSDAPLYQVTARLSAEPRPGAGLAGHGQAATRGRRSRSDEERLPVRRALSLRDEGVHPKRTAPLRGGTESLRVLLLVQGQAREGVGHYCRGLRTR